jgi:hypothetical protein
MVAVVIGRKFKMGDIVKVLKIFSGVKVLKFPIRRHYSLLCLSCLESFRFCIF